MEKVIENKGWVKLSRSLLDSRVFANPTLLKIYIWCLIKANHTTKWVRLKTGKGFTEVKVHRGSFITGRNRASEELQMAPSTYSINIKKLEDLKFVRRKSYSHFTKLKVIGYLSNQSSKKQPNSTTKELNTLAQSGTEQLIYLLGNGVSANNLEQLIID